jgi:single-stranded DNA-binding protein
MPDFLPVENLQNHIEIAGRITDIGDLVTEKNGDHVISFNIENTSLGRTSNFRVTSYNNAADDAAKYGLGTLVVVEGKIYQEKRKGKNTTMIQAETIYLEYESCLEYIPSYMLASFKSLLKNKNV